MATYTELYGLLSDSALQNRVAIAVMIAAEQIRTEDAGTANHANRVVWAKRALNDPLSLGDDFLRALLAQNYNASVAVIQAASDATIQAAVNNAVNIFADGS